jgi:hypothetical protein
VLARRVVGNIAAGKRVVKSTMISSDPTIEPRPRVTWTPADTEAVLRERGFNASVEPWTDRDTEALRRELDAAA